VGIFSEGDKMIQTVVCRFCKKNIDKITAYKVADRQYYCNEDCYSNYINKQKYKPPKKNTDGVENERRKLTDAILDIYVKNGIDKHTINWKVISAQMKNYLVDGLTYAGMRLTLDYLVNIKEVNLFNEQYAGSILNLIPFSYDEAKNFYVEKQVINKEIESKTDDFFKDEIVYVSPHKERIWPKKHDESIEDL